MRRRFLHLATISVFILALTGVAAAQQPIDLAIVGGTILTMDSEANVIVDGYIAIHKDRIVALGPRTRLMKEFRPK
jgi:imidazolonepropionase-like amidohydrolase